MKKGEAMKMESRSQVLQVRVTPREKVMVEKHCHRRGEAVSEYLRSAALTCMVMEGSGDGLKVLGEAVRLAVRKRFEEWTSREERVAVP